MLRTRAAPGLLFALVLGALTLASGPVSAEDQDVLRIPTVKGITVDGRHDEAGWDAALGVQPQAVDVPSATGRTRVTPALKLGLQDGKLVIAAGMAEAPGGSIGFHLFVAPDGATSARDAISIDVRPMELRAPRYRAIGPRGVGRKHYRIDAAVRIDDPTRWTCEASIPMAELSNGKTDAQLRMAIAVYSRTQNVISTWPEGAAWGSPARWTLVAPPAGGWPQDATVDAKRFEEEDVADEARQTAWLEYLRGISQPVLPVAPAAEIQAKLTENLLKPLARVRQHRPDLAVPLDCLMGDIHHRLGRPLDAERHYQDALGRAPGWREAGYGLYVKVRGSWAAMGTPGAPTDVAAARARLDGLFDPEAHPAAAAYARDGRALAEALLAYKQGEHEAPKATLGTLAARYPFDAFIDAHHRMTLRLQRAQGEEARFRARDAKTKLPRAILDTTAGRIVLELFHDDARNTVFNFVWLAKHGFYDDCAVHRTVPFFLAQTGDPFSRKATARPDLVGSGTPGYAIRTELGRRWPLRGYVAMANGGPDTDGSQFMFFTGSAVHLRGEVTVFARVIEGMNVVDALRAGEDPHRIRGVTLEQLDPERQYHPSTLSGNRAPKPKAPEVR